MSTSRVPGITRNSGWRFVDETIVAARTRDLRPSEPSATWANLQAEESVREFAESREPAPSGSTWAASDA